MAVPSPCISICTVDEPTGLCKGCKRSVVEIGMWLYLSDEDKRKIIEQLPARKLSGESQ